MKRYIVIDTDCESDVWFDNSENKILHYEEIEEILEKQDTKWQKLKEWLKLQIDGLNEQLVDYDFDSDCRELSIENFKIMLQQMQELEAEDESKNN